MYMYMVDYVQLVIHDILSQYDAIVQAAQFDCGPFVLETRNERGKEK